MRRNEPSEDDDEEHKWDRMDDWGRELRLRLLCVVTAFELLTGQGIPFVCLRF